MALNRRNGQRFEANIWPGFVDAMTALLLVLVFVLSIFMIVQFMLRETITAQDGELDNLNLEVSALVDALGLERDRSQDLTEQALSLNSQIDSQISEAAQQENLIAALQQQTVDQSARIGSFEEQVVGLLAQQSDLRGQVASLDQERSSLLGDVDQLSQENQSANEQVNSLTARITDLEAGLSREITSKEAAQLALARARDEIDVSTEQARLAAARREALEALVADLRTETDTKSQLLAETDAALSKEQADRLVEAAAAEALRERLSNASAELTAMSLRLDDRRREAEETLSLLAAARAVEDDLNDRLINALAATRSSQEAALASEETLRSELTSIRSKLAASERRTTVLLDQLQTAQGQKVTIDNLRAQLDAAVAAKANSEIEFDQARSKADEIVRDLLDKIQSIESSSAETSTSLRAELAAALAAENAARERADGALTISEQRQALLATAQSELATEREISSESSRRVEALNQQIAQLRGQLSGLQNLLDASNARDSDADIEIQSLGSKLNQALAQVAAEQKRVAEEQRLRAELEETERLRLQAEATELKNYRSEFFGQLRSLLGNQDGIRIEGDRFVFSSEVLFQSGQATLSAEGQQEVAKVARILSLIADDIPNTLDWVIRVDGHTDNSPLSGFGEFSDNWELSQARALSVVRFMSQSLGIPPNRLAANGFGEYQPIAQGDSSEARAQNRRIELKLTER